MRRVFLHTLAGAGVLLLAAMIIVGGLLTAPAKSGVALADGRADISGPTPPNAAQDAVRADQGTSRDTERPTLVASAAQLRATQQRELAMARQQRALAIRQAALKKKADEARKKKIAADKARAARIRKLGYEPGTTSPKAIAKQILKNKYGYGSDQFSCFNNIIMRESMWNIHATNAGSGAYGIPQALPGNKMASVASDWRTNPATQIIWGIQYMKSTYGSPCAAWSFKSAHGWY